MDEQDYLQYIETDTAKRCGKPCIKGTRITVIDILEMLAEGMSTDEILKDHPNLQAVQIKAALLYAANTITLIRLTVGNAKLAVVERVLIDNQQTIHSFLDDEGKGLLVL
ncbi:DUF433 domain-containing protein [Endozoicomonas sp. ALB091]|uniref:DUF433 domain-containing protein n=1 Tax=Endozoicomonas sp. ALB091 TaxID=3403073 RepID=UPI003BB55539